MKSGELCGIRRLYERDIDMLVAEELRLNIGFCDWILGHLDVPNGIVAPAHHTDVSVVDDGSEADVVATFQTFDGLLHRVFVENKIDASLMPKQLERYVRRGEGEVRLGRIATFSVLFFTPSNYLRSVLPPRVVQISFESAALMLRSQGDPRADYRASLLEQALPIRSTKARDAHVAQTEPYIKGWWDSVYAMLEQEFPGFFIHKTRYPRSVFFAPETLGQARYLRLDFKGHKGEVDLAFKNVPLEKLQEVLSTLTAPPGILVGNGKSAAIRIEGLDPFVISDGEAVVRTKVRRAYQAGYDLLSYWQINQSTFDAIRNANPSSVGRARGVL